MQVVPGTWDDFMPVMEETLSEKNPGCSSTASEDITPSHPVSRKQLIPRARGEREAVQSAQIGIELLFRRKTVERNVTQGRNRFDCGMVLIASLFKKACNLHACREACPCFSPRSYQQSQAPAVAPPLRETCICPRCSSIIFSPPRI